MKRQLATISAVGLLATAGFIGTIPADAAETATFTNVTVSGDTAKPNDVLTLAADISMPDRPEPGDTGFLPLPPELIPANGISDFPINNSAGATVWNAHYDAARGGIVITATDFVKTNPLNVKGKIYFSAQVTSDAKPGEKIVVRWGGVEKVITVEQGWNGKGNAVKIPWKGAYQTGTRDIGWQRDSVGPYDSAHITDTPHNATVKCDSLRLLKGDQRDGSYPEDAQGDWKLDRLQNVHCGPDGFSADLPALPKGYLHHMTYLTTPNAGVAEITNEWTLVSSLGTTGGTSASKVYGAGGSGDGENEPTAPPTEEPTPEPSTPTEEPTTPPATDEPTPEPTKSEEPSPEPSKSEEPAPEPTKSEEPTPCPTSDAPTAEPSTEPTPSDSPSGTPGTPQPSDGCAPIPSATPSLPPTGEPSVPGSERPAPPVTPGAPNKEEPSSHASENPAPKKSEKPKNVSEKPLVTPSTPVLETSAPSGTKGPSTSVPSKQHSAATTSSASSASGGKGSQGSDGAAHEALAYTGTHLGWIISVAVVAIGAGVAGLIVNNRRKGGRK